MIVNDLKVRGPNYTKKLYRDEIKKLCKGTLCHLPKLKSLNFQAFVGSNSIRNQTNS